MLRKRLFYHQQLAQKLASVYLGKTPVSSYLFLGELGSGRDYIANFYAKILLCQQGGIEPCGECQSCKLFERGSHPDFHYFKEYKIEHFKELKNLAYRAPLIAKRRVFLFDTAENFNQSCANAILKILEEPPSHLFFILTATSSQSVLPTIVSRCLKFNTFSESKEEILDNYDLLYYLGKDDYRLLKEELSELWSKTEITWEIFANWWIRWQNLLEVAGEDKKLLYRYIWEGEHLVFYSVDAILNSQLNIDLFLIFFLNFLDTFKTETFFEQYSYLELDKYFLNKFIETLLSQTLESNLLTIQHKQNIIKTILRGKKAILFNINKELILLEVLKTVKGS